MQQNTGTVLQNTGTVLNLQVATTEYRYAGMACMCAPPRGFMRATARAIDLLLQYAVQNEKIWQCY